MIRAGGLWTKDRQQLEGCKRYPNPEWMAWNIIKDRLAYRPAEPPKHLQTWKEHRAWAVFPRWWSDAPARDLTVLPHGPQQRFKWKLRPYQEQAQSAWLQTRQGVIQAPCGAGKTVIGASIIAQMETPALVLVHTRDLLRQWQERLQEALHEPQIGIIGGGKDQRHQAIVIATLQTLAKWPFQELLEYGKTRGLVVVDECHHIPASTFSEVIMGLNGRYRLGLTATPERLDGLTGLLHDHLGPMVHQIDPEQLEGIGATLKPQIRFVKTDWSPPMHSEPHERKRLIATDEQRNAQILDLVEDQHEEGRLVLVLCDLRQHCQDLAEQSRSPAAAITGKNTPKQRAAMFDALRQRQITAIFCTSLADEGLDLPELDTVILATPCRNVARVEQRIGRALRPLAGKADPLVIDLIDDFGPYKGYGRKRATLYRKRGWL